MESPYYEMAHDFDEENRLFQSGYVKGYYDAVLRSPHIVRCKDCKHGEKCNSVYLCGKSRGFGIAHDPAWFCADGERKDTE